MRVGSEVVPSLIKKQRAYIAAKAVQAWRQRGLYLLLLPAVALTVTFCYIPIYGISIAFKDFSILKGYGSPWIRPLFSHFWFVTDPTFWQVMGNTVRISALKFFFGFAPPIVLALLFNEIVQQWYKRLVQTLFYLPHFISWVILSALVYRLLDFEPSSPINFVRSWFGLEPIALMIKPGAFIPILIVSDIYQSVGWGSIIYLASIMNIDPELYESAVVDGAGKWVQTWHITIPGMIPIISILLVLRIPGLLSAGFDQIYNLLNPYVMRVAMVSDIYVLQVGLIQGNYAFGTALGFTFSVVALGLTLTANKISKTAGGSGIW